MADDRSILPPNATPLERAMETADARRAALPVELIREVWNPQTCPVELLPYLAWGLGLEIWKDEWPEAKKRDVVARIWLMKRRKTTLQGIRDYVELVGAKVVKAVRPRDMVFCVDPWSEDERAEIEAAMPQIRIYPQARMFAADGGELFWDDAILDFDCAATPSDAALRYAERAVFVDGGVETPVTVEGIDGADDIKKRIALAKAGDVARAVADVWTASWHALEPNETDGGLISIRPDPSAHNFAVPPGLVPETVAPERVVEDVVAAPAMAFDYFVANLAALYPSDAEEHVYDRLRLFDAKRLPGAGRGVSFWDWSPFGSPPYTAELTLDIPMQGVPWGIPGPADLGVAYDPDFAPFWDALEAVEIAQAERDDIWVSTRLYEPLALHGGLVLGQFRLGDYQRA